jgi:beta-lactamase class A
MYMSARQILIYSLLLIAGGLIGWFIAIKKSSSPQIVAPIEIREDSARYKFINPLIYSRVSKNFYATEFETFNEDIQKEIDDYVRRSYATDISVYFRDLNTGHWTGINENQMYEPSSMLKVVLMITYLKDSIDDPALLSKKLYYKGADESGQYYTSKNHLTADYYSVNELITAMIVDSDNAATAILIQNNEKDFQKVYNDFRLPNPPADPDSTDFMSARSYSVIFRALFNATYLPRNLSEQALQLLSKTDFTAGLRAGIPQGVEVSQKFGEHTYLLPDGVVTARELHDCGIIYYPEHPYLLCIMTKGKDFSHLEKVISDLSRSVYAHVDKSMKK